MDPFGGDDLFDIFGGAHSIVAEPTTAPISQKRKADLPEHEDKRSKAKHESNIPIIEEDVVEIITPSAAGAEPLNTKIVRSQGGKLSDDYFAQYVYNFLHTCYEFTCGLCDYIPLHICYFIIYLYLIFPLSNRERFIYICYHFLQIQFIIYFLILF